jgi:hypothetical protein
MDENMNPVFQTERFDVYRFRSRHRTLDGAECDTYLAYLRFCVAPMPICTVTVDRKVPGQHHMVVWIEVCGEWRRHGYATEVILGLEGYLGPLHVFDLSEAGCEFVTTLPARMQVPEEYRVSAEQEQRARREIRKALDEAEREGKPANLGLLMERLANECMEERNRSNARVESPGD